MFIESCSLLPLAEREKEKERRCASLIEIGLTSGSDDHPTLHRWIPVSGCRLSKWGERKQQRERPSEIMNWIPCSGISIGRNKKKKQRKPQKNQLDQIKHSSASGIVLFLSNLGFICTEVGEDIQFLLEMEGWLYCAYLMVLPMNFIPILYRFGEIKVKFHKRKGRLT